MEFYVIHIFSFYQFKNLETEKELLMASNTSLAEFNLSKQPELQEGKQILKELSEKGSRLCMSVKEKLDEISMYSFFFPVLVLVIYST